VLLRSSAHRHGWEAADILWALRHALSSTVVETRAGTGVKGVLHLGPARDGRMLEVLVVEDDDGREQVIHAMAMRRQYLPLLEGPR